MASNKQYIKFKDILLCKINPRINRVWCVKENTEFPQIGSSEWIVIRQPLIHEGFLTYFLQTQSFRDLLCSDVSGVGGSLTRAQPKRVATYHVPIAPFQEQKIIAEKLDTLLAQVDSTKARLEQIPQILKRFRQAVLAAAVRGELTEGWHTDQNLVSAKSILNEIETERSQAKNNKLIKQSFGKYKVISPLFNVPSNSWEWVCLEQICATNNNALKAGPFGSALKKADCVEVGYKVYGQEQVISGSESLETYRINDDKYEQLKSCTTGPGDILISLVGTIGKVLVLSPQAEFGIINPRLVKITLHNTISPQYIKTYLDSPVSHSFFKGFSHGGTMEILNLSILKELPIALPPLEEQHEIVRRVEQLFAYADTIEKQVNNALTRVNSLTQSILAKAFRGELTAQWRAENPSLISGENSAAALLEKIKAERAASGGKKTSRKKA
ncbi:restriction endonuclease subunit S [Salmonella enterica subsp. enterica serovar Kintambo]|nr:restriction endonuclease subunit S [Salmonella enterica subsp. enterica serovar Kintambo]